MGDARDLRILAKAEPAVAPDFEPPRRARGRSTERGLPRSASCRACLAGEPHNRADERPSAASSTSAKFLRNCSPGGSIAVRLRRFISVGACASLALVWLAGCATVPPSAPDQICRVFEENDDWLDDAQEAAERWGIEVPILMAFMRHESSFRDDAKPPRTKLLWFIPWKRPSSAYGYAQATDEAWDEYRRSTGNRWADRDDFDDAADFIGWFSDASHRELDIPKDDPYRLYLAYHVGRGGYRRGTYSGNARLLETAKRVRAKAEQYARDLRRCS